MLQCGGAGTWYGSMDIRLQNVLWEGGGSVMPPLRSSPPTTKCNTAPTVFCIPEVSSAISAQTLATSAFPVSCFEIFVYANTGSISCYRQPDVTPWCTFLLEKLTGLQLVQKLPAFYGTRMFITAFTNSRQLSLS